MALRLGALQDALIAAGAPEDKATAAAEELANYNTRFNEIDGSLSLLKWMVGTNTALLIAVLMRLLVTL